MELGPDDRQRQHVASCKPNRDTAPSRISQPCHTIPQSHHISFNLHHVTLGSPLPGGIMGTDSIPHIHHLFERRWDCPNHNSTAPDRGSSSCSLLASSSQFKHAASSSQSRLLILDPALVGQSQAKLQGRHDSYLQQYTIHMYIRASPYQSKHYSCETRVVTIILPLR